MNIKEILKANKITQEEFADHIGMTREGLNLNLNKGNQKKMMIDSLKLLVSEKRGVKIDVKLY